MNEISLLKMRRTKLLNKNCKNLKDFEEIQNKLNDIEFEMKSNIERRKTNENNY